MAWTVTSTSETMGTGDNGLPVKGVNVSFTVDNGESGSVFVPENVFALGVDAIKARIAPRAAILTALKGLTG